MPTTEINPRDLAQLRRRWERIATDLADFRSDRTASVVLALLDEIDRLRAEVASLTSYSEALFRGQHSLDGVTDAPE